MFSSQEREETKFNKNHEKWVEQELRISNSKKQG
jgi:hypothetical protein